MSAETKMSAETARAIIRQAREDDVYEGPVPEDDAKAISEAEGLVEMASTAWESNVKGPEVEAILRIHAGVSNGDTAAADPEPEPEAKVEEPAAEPPTADEPAGMSDEYLTTVEPWEDYNADKVSAIVESLEYVKESEGEQEWLELAGHVWAYESAHKNRKTIIEALERLAGQEASGAQAPQGEEEPPAAPEGEGDTPDADAGADDSGDASGVEGREDGGSEVQGDDPPQPDGDADAEAQPGPEAPSASEEDRDGGDEAQPSAPDRHPDVAHDPELDELTAEVEAMLTRERLHVPPQIEADPVDMPMDLTTLSDTQLQGLHSAFSAYAYRAGFLYMMEEARARKCKEAADELAQSLLVHADRQDPQTGKPKTITLVEAEVEQDENVKKWRKRQRRFSTFAEAYRHERDQYQRYVESLSRHETMRHNEYERSGGGRKR